MNTKLLLFFFGAIFLFGSIIWPQADIVIQKVSIDPEKPIPGDVVKITAIITNPTLYDFKGTLKIQIILDDKPVFEQEENGFPSQSVKTYQQEVAPTPGDHSIKIIADPGSEMELDAINNIDELRFSVLTVDERKNREHEAEIKDLPDLVCEEMIRPAKVDMIPGNTVIFYAVFTLYGNEPIPGPFATTWVMDDKVLAKINVKNFPPNIKWKFGMKWAAKTGRHDLKASIDTDNIIKEKNDDSNNTCELTFSVHPKSPEFDERGPDSRIRKFGFQQNLDAIKDDPVYIEEVLIEPVSAEDEKDPNLQKITYVVYNGGTREYRNIQITASLPDKFFHSFYIERLPSGDRYEMSFIESVGKGTINFNITLEELTIEQQGFFIQEGEVK
jgi:hypothetical protein